MGGGFKETINLYPENIEKLGDHDKKVNVKEEVVDGEAVAAEPKTPSADKGGTSNKVEVSVDLLINLFGRRFKGEELIISLFSYSPDRFLLRHLNARRNRPVHQRQRNGKLRLSA